VGNVQTKRCTDLRAPPRGGNVFDLRTEAEMRLHSEKLARELALKKQGEEGGEHATTRPAVTADAESAD
jgi:hypothetical protein